MQTMRAALLCCTYLLCLSNFHATAFEMQEKVAPTNRRQKTERLLCQFVESIDPKGLRQG